MTKHCYTQTTRETFITMNIRMCRDCHIQAIFSATKAKAKAYNTCIAPQVAYRNGKGAGHDTEKAGVVPIGRRLSLRPQADLWPTIAKRMRLLCPLMVSTPVTHVITWITTHLPTQKGWKAELAWLFDPLGTPYPWSGHTLTIDQAHIRESSPVRDRGLTTEPRPQLRYTTNTLFVLFAIIN